MKKAFIDQLFLGFLLLMGIATFVATVSDEASSRNKFYDLKLLAVKTSQTLARSYESNMNMCYGKTIAEDILNESSLGKEILELKKNSGLTFDYDFYDMSPTNADGTVGDGQPDTVITTISGYKQSTFWYRFFNKDAFELNTVTATENVDTPKDVTIRYGARPSASYQNIMGTYELDNNNCVTNMKSYMANSKDWDKWEQLSDPSDPNSDRIPIADGIESPPTYVFSIANGNNQFNQPADNAPIVLEENHCFNDGSYPKITMNGVTKQATVGNVDSGNIFFEHDELNADGFNHFHIIPTTILPDYINYKNNIYNASGNEKDKYEAFLSYCNSVNTDATSSNDIGAGFEDSCTIDPNDEYQYALEDLDAAGSDFDFTDMLLDSTRLVKDNTSDHYSVDSSHKIVFDSGYCEDDIPNVPPTLELQGCPITINEDTPTSSISWTAADSDGTIQSKDISTSYGSAVINPNGTITYTPDSDYYGEDTIIMIVKDDDDAIAKKECSVTITEVNDPPTITGTPITRVLIGETYNFIPTADDVDGDVLTFSITNKPSWLTFDSVTGQLTGVPITADEGLYANITITVSDGRGGTASLPVFTIEVVSTNQGPKQSGPIPDHNAIEDNTYTFDLSDYFSDTDGDTLTYTITTTGAITQTMTNTTGLISIDLPDGIAGAVIYVHVSVTDNVETVTDDYVVTITSNSDCNGPFESTFTGIDDGWNRGTLTSNDNYRIEGGYKDAYVQHFFGQGCKNINIRLTFKYRTNNNWEDSDKFDLYINGSFKAKYAKTNANWVDKSEVVQTNNDGWLTIQFYTNSNNNNEKVKIDNVRAEKE